jgi:hypothetical protein
MTIISTVGRLAGHAVAAASALRQALTPAVVEAHCDTADGPAVTDGRKALASGNVNDALPWIPASGEAELRDVFAMAVRVRGLGTDAAELADRLFLETLVRLHRMGEGVGFTGIQPTGTHDPVVAAADAAIALGSDAALLPLVPEDRRGELSRRFREALALRERDVDDVVAGRRYIAAYVSFFMYAEGEEHEQEHPRHTAHAHGDAAHAGHTHDDEHVHAGAR